MKEGRRRVGVHRGRRPDSFLAKVQRVLYAGVQHANRNRGRQFNAKAHFARFVPPVSGPRLDPWPFERGREVKLPSMDGDSSLRARMNRQKPAVDIEARPIIIQRTVPTSGRESSANRLDVPAEHKAKAFDR
jgi:hypothetical protein